MGVFVDPFDKIEKEMMAAFANEINDIIRKESSAVIRRLKDKVPDWLREQPEVQSLLDTGVPNSLCAQFGLPPGQNLQAVEAICKIMADSIKVDLTGVDAGFVGGVTFEFDPEHFARLLTIPEGTVKTEKGANLDWLNWLLTRGDSVIVTGYQYSPSDNGRSGGGTMKGGSVWRVPPEYSGTEDNNFITRAFEDKQNDIENILKDIIL